MGGGSLLLQITHLIQSADENEMHLQLSQEPSDDQLLEVAGQFRSLPRSGSGLSSSTVLSLGRTMYEDTPGTETDLEPAQFSVWDGKCLLLCTFE